MFGILGRLRRGSAGVRHRQIPIGTSPLVVFSGGLRWLDEGCDLYAAEALVRHLIDGVDSDVVALAGFAPSHAFATRSLPASASFSERRIAHVINGALLCMAAGELLKSRGAEAKAVAGLSLGETCAAFAAGALTRNEAARMLCALVTSLPHEDRLCRQFTMQLPVADALELCRAAPVPLQLFGEPSRGAAVLMAEQAYADEAGRFLAKAGKVIDSSETRGWYHLEHVPFDEDLFTRISAPLQPELPRVPLYSAGQGGAVRGELGTAFWRRTVDGPHRFGSAISAALADGHDGVLVIGPRMIGDWIVRGAAAGGTPVAVAAWDEVLAA